MEDRRLDEYDIILKNQVLVERKWKSGFRKMDREHCELCCAQFGSGTLDFSEGFCTQDQYYWICKRCYEAKKTHFRWTVRR